MLLSFFTFSSQNKIDEGKSTSEGNYHTFKTLKNENLLL